MLQVGLHIFHGGNLMIFLTVHHELTIH